MGSVRGGKMLRSKYFVHLHFVKLLLKQLHLQRKSNKGALCETAKVGKLKREDKLAYILGQIDR